jgi:hypothetical protein
VVLAILVQLPGLSRPRALPILVALYRSPEEVRLPPLSRQKTVFIRETGNASFFSLFASVAAVIPGHQSQGRSPSPDKHPTVSRIPQALMQTFSIEERQVQLQALMEQADGLVIVTIHMLVLHTPPQPLNEHVIQRSPFVIHANPDSGSRQTLNEPHARELHPLIRIENLWTLADYRCTAGTPMGVSVFNTLQNMPLHAKCIAYWPIPLNFPAFLDQHLQSVRFRKILLNVFIREPYTGVACGAGPNRACVQRCVVDLPQSLDDLWQINWAEAVGGRNTCP